MEKKTIAILFGGMSPEYAVSLQSAHAVITHLDREQYNPVLLGITQKGQWYRYRGKPENILQDTWCDPAYCTEAFLSPCRKNAGVVEFGIGVTVFTKIDAAFPVMHGALGEDGSVQGLLALAGIPVVGCGTLASAACMDKDVAHKLVACTGVSVPKSACFSEAATLPEIAAEAEALGYPLFVKPVNAGSSFGISRVEEPAKLAAAVAQAFGFDSQIILEEAIPGFEVGCAVLGGAGALTLGAPDEIELAEGFFDFNEKYNLVTSKIHVPARISAEKAAEVQQAAAKIYTALGCGGFARVDMFLKPDGALVFNEVNTIPGFTPHSRYPAMMAAAGLPFPEVLTTLIRSAVPA